MRRSRWSSSSTKRLQDSIFLARIRSGRKMGDTELSPKSLREIIGVVDDVKEGSLDSEIWPAEYTPINQDADTYVGLVVRTSQDEKSVLPDAERDHSSDRSWHRRVGRGDDDAADQ